MSEFRTTTEWRSPGHWRDVRIWLIEKIPFQNYQVGGADLRDPNRRVIWFRDRKDAVLFTLTWGS